MALECDLFQLPSKYNIVCSYIQINKEQVLQKIHLAL